MSSTDLKEKEQTPSAASIDKVEGASTEVDPAFERRTMYERFFNNTPKSVLTFLLHRLWIDFRILPVLALVYSFALIDRINLGAAYAAGMGKDLHLTVGSRYSLVACLYFVPYIIFQLPGNLVLRRVGVRNWLTFLVVAWGAVQLGMGFSKDWIDLLITLFADDCLPPQAPFFPSLLWIIASWYKRHEVQKRMAVFYLISVTASGLSPLLAYGLSLLNGKQGLAGWRWVFIVEGAITLFLAIVCFLFIPAFPEENTFLTKEQTELVVRRVNEDRGDALPDEITFKKVLTHLSDWTLWAYGLMFMCTAMPNYVQSYFVPIILTGMGYSPRDALLRSAPPYGPAIPVTLLVAYLSDKYKHRASFILVLSLICLLGCALVAWHPNNNLINLMRKGCFLINSGNSGTIPTVLAYSANNVVSHSKRSVQTALTVSLGAFGGILAATCFRAVDYPRYIPGLSATLGSQGLLFILLTAVTIRHYRKNKLMREGKLSEPLEGTPGFFYTL
ncbi:hypothetical protein EST38_g11403 [Candolleomyces aberdarensis]|uniref:Major facilitator superfamily (MFS) profile domain-containing protein n=1 Tax=Candolleomyces aberdarensis TaxID=2316362 RepID=A0A4Q2D782_9AGAR|nr:hypothetical protein EST38_g11403 [Candolleomyces aberdarensis]